MAEPPTKPHKLLKMRNIRMDIADTKQRILFRPIYMYRYVIYRYIYCIYTHRIYTNG